MPTETIRPTDAYNPGGFSNPGNAYDADTGTSADNTNLNATPGISLGGNNADETVAAWASKAQTWSAATVYCTFAKTAGSNDTVELLVTDQNGTLKHTLQASTSGSVTKQEFSATLNSADWGGSGFPNIGNLRIRCNGSKSGGPDGATASLYDARIDGTYTSVANYTYTGVGGASSGGLAAIVLGIALAGAGGLQSGGAGDRVIGWVPGVLGGVQAGGAAITAPEYHYLYSPAGGAQSGGAAPIVAGWIPSPAGGASSGGAATTSFAAASTGGGGLYIPDVRLEVPRLLIPGMAPVTRCKMDRAHPLAADSFFLFGPNGGQDLGKNGYDVTLPANGKITAEGWDSVSGANCGNFGPVDVGAGTLTLHLKPTGTWSSDAYRFLYSIFSGGNINISWTYTGSGNFSASIRGAYTPSSGSSVSTYDPVNANQNEYERERILTVRWQHGVTPAIQWFEHGQQQTSGGVVFGVGGLANLQDSAFLSNVISILRSWQLHTRCLSDEEASAINTDPYQALIPE